MDSESELDMIIIFFFGQTLISFILLWWAVRWKT